MIDLCGSYGNLGRHFRLAGDAAAAIPWFDRCIDLTRKVLDKEPNQQESRQILRNALASRALALDAIGRHADALTELDKAIALTQGEAMLNRQLVHRARILLHLGRHDDAITQAEAASQSPSLTAE